MRSLNLYLYAIFLSTALPACEAEKPDHSFQIRSCEGSIITVKSTKLLNQKWDSVSGSFRMNTEESRNDFKEAQQRLIEECGSLPRSAFMEMAHKALLSSLRDPDSAKLKYSLIMPNKNQPLPYTYSVSVNAKNAYGGYTGYKTFYVSIDIEKGEWSIKRW